GRAHRLLAGGLLDGRLLGHDHAASLVADRRRAADISESAQALTSTVSFASGDFSQAARRRISARSADIGAISRASRTGAAAPSDWRGSRARVRSASAVSRSRLTALSMLSAARRSSWAVMRAMAIVMLTGFCT